MCPGDSALPVSGSQIRRTDAMESGTETACDDDVGPRESPNSFTMHLTREPDRCVSMPGHRLAAADSVRDGTARLVSGAIVAHSSSEVKL